MSDIYFNCGRCSQKLVVDAQGIGMSLPCPTCGISLIVPETSVPKPVVRILVQEAPEPIPSIPEPETPDIQKLTETVRRAAQDMECEIENDALELVARSANGDEQDAMWRLRVVLQYGRSGSLAPVVTGEMAAEALKKFFSEKRPAASARKHY